MKNRTLLFTLLFFLGSYVTFACDVCKKDQPKGFENITHGAGPSGDFDYIIIWSAIIIVGFTLFYSAKYLIKPKETNPDHIKNIVRNEGF
ncbi:hypothetical protein BZARG_2156 [Bizionia argentinensis JUB59]|uniref:Cbb3-type cytochrome c oxidase subunit CcoP N-terminal domain-containing protein n=1 Tax=Bizionia argentinensis JUB59 TaxID=1046627 RepID=G2EAG4_9FLAO|nr:hypothetical protein [Bizionia argentinensis]EGV44548.1 hypothetical protein BZARG_2156 [Bizionia argentinensis JUB59]